MTGTGSFVFPVMQRADRITFQRPHALTSLHLSAACMSPLATVDQAPSVFVVAGHDTSQLGVSNSARIIASAIGISQNPTGGDWLFDTLADFQPNGLFIPSDFPLCLYVSLPSAFRVVAICALHLVPVR